MRLLIRSVVILFLFTAILLQAFPQLLFNRHHKFGNISVYHDVSESADLVANLPQAETLLKKSPLYDEEQQYNIFIVNQNFVYSILSADFSSSAFAITNIFNNIIIRECDDFLEFCFSKAKEHNMRSLSGLIVHEATHVDIRSKFGFLNEFLIPSWKKEGLCDYVAESSSYINDGIKDTKAYDYYLYRLLAEYAINVKKLEVEDYLTQDIDMKALITECGC
jgi:hypothetical protein